MLFKSHIYEQRVKYGCGERGEGERERTQNMPGYLNKGMGQNMPGYLNKDMGERDKIFQDT